MISNNEKNENLPVRESNPGLPRDRRGYSPLYYRGLRNSRISGRGRRLHGINEKKTTYFTRVTGVPSDPNNVETTRKR